MQLNCSMQNVCCAKHLAELVDIVQKRIKFTELNKFNLI